MASPKRRKPHRIVADLSDEDRKLLSELVSHEKDTVTNVLRRMIRAHHKRTFSPKPQALTLRLPQSTPDFSNLSEKEPSR